MFQASGPYYADFHLRRSSQLIAQLKPGGSMLIPLGAAGEMQFLNVMVKRAGGSISSQRSLPVRFVPLTRNK